MFDFDVQLRNFIVNKKKSRWFCFFMLVLSSLTVYTVYALSLSFAVALNDVRVDFGSYITSASVSTLKNGEWTETWELMVGDSVKVSIEYTLDNNVVDSQNRIISYDMPNVFVLEKEQQGTVRDKGRTVGTYTISKDGKIAITFNNDFVIDGEGFAGQIQFQGTVSCDLDKDETKNIVIGNNTGTITIKPENIKTDISLEKSGTVSKDKSQIDYTLTVSTKNGTGGNVEISDAFTNASASAGYDKNSLNVTRVTEEGNRITVSNYSPVFGTSGGLQKFSINNLPELGAGEQYIITYTANNISLPNSGSGEASVANYAKAASNGKSSDRQIYTQVQNAVVSKSGNYNSKTGKVSWTININSQGRDLNGYTVSDRLDGDDFTGKVVLSSSSGDSKEVSLPYTFPKNSSGAYTIAYDTEPPEGTEVISSKTVNQVHLKKDAYDFTATKEIYVTHESNSFNKTFERTEEESEDKALYWWTGTIHLAKSVAAGEKLTYTDTIIDAEDENNVENHYTTVSLMRKLSVEIDNKITDKYSISYYDINGDKINQTDNLTHVKSFEIIFDTKEDINAEDIKIKYPTYADYSQIAYGETKEFVNKAKTPYGSKEAVHKYTKQAPLEKQIIKTDDSGTKTYISGTTDIDFDETEGKLNYRVLIRTDKFPPGDIVLNDIIPFGTVFDKDSISAAFYQNDWYEYTSISYWDSTSQSNRTYDLAGKDKPTVIIDDGVAVITVPDGYNGNGNKNTISLKYSINIADDTIWEDLTVKTSIYTNTIKWGNYSSKQTAHVNRNVNKVSKNGIQLVDEDGNPTNIIEYSVLLNPASEDLIQGSDTISVKDILSTGKSVNAELNPSSVKLYSYSPRAENGRGEEISSERYSVKYDYEDDEITFTIPDNLACVLSYQYVFQRDSIAGNIPISNSVELSGDKIYNYATRTMLAESSSSASATKRKLTIYKVDDKNYLKTLPNAVFELEYFDSASSGWKKENTYRTSTNGIIEFDFAKGEIKQNILYRLTETVPPSGYTMDNDKHYFVLMERNKTKEETVSVMGKGMAGVSPDVVKFINYNGGAIYISNEYTELTLNKLWSNEEGGAATPKEGSVTFELYRQAYRLEYSTITVNVKSLGGVWSKNIKVAKGSGATIAVSGNWNVQYTVTYNGEVSKVSADGATAVYTIGQTSGDAVVEFTSDTWVTPEIQFTDYNQPTVKIKEGESQKVDTVDLNAGNRWSYTWSALPKEDASGNELRYSVVETSTGNYTVTYLNNEGIQTGVITVTNVVKGSYILPETGGSGRAGYIVLGLLLMLISLFYWYRIKCRHEKINQTFRYNEIYGDINYKLQITERKYKKMKKLLTILMSFIMAFTVSVSAFGAQRAGENSGEIIINNAVKDQTYNAYRIFDLSWDGSSAYNYTINREWKSFVLQKDSEGNYLYIGVYFSYDENTGAITQLSTSESELQKFAQEAIAYARNNNTIEPAGTAKGVGDEETATATIQNIPLGYYLVDSSVGSLVILNTTNTQMNVMEKNGVPSIIKRVNENSVIDSWRDENDADIGENVNFSITATVGKGAINYCIIDTMDKGLTLNKDSFEINYNNAGASETGERIDPKYYTISYDGDGYTFKIDFENEFVSALAEGSTITVRYSAELNENATLGRANPNVNSTYLTYGDGNTTAMAQTKTYTYRFGIIKTNDSNIQIDGAEFKIYDYRDIENYDPIRLVKIENEEGQTVYRRATAKEIQAGLTTDTIVAGNVLLTGFDASTYYLSETKAPEGFNRSSEVKEITIRLNSLVTVEKINSEVENDDGTTTIVEQIKYISGGVQVINYNGSLLPSTGGIGTTVFYIVGGILVLLAIVLFAVKSMRKKEQNLLK